MPYTRGRYRMLVYGFYMFTLTTNCLYLTLNMYKFHSYPSKSIYLREPHFGPSFNVPALITFSILTSCTQHFGDFFLFTVAFNHLLFGVFLTHSCLKVSGSFNLVQPDFGCAHLRNTLWKDAGVKCIRNFPTSGFAAV